MARKKLNIFPNLITGVVFLCLFRIPFGLNGQDITKINPVLLHNKWNAQWISYPGISLKDYGVFHFRKRFDLDQRPATFVVHVSGDNRYRLFVNGKDVCNGPARGDLMHWRFETVDIAEHLIAGENIIAATVWNFGEFMPLAQISNKTAFIVQGNASFEEMINTGDSWKVYKNEAYVPPVIKPARSVVGQGEQVDGAKYPYGWTQIDYHEQGWKQPVALSSGFPYGRYGAWDWMLVPRNIPFMESRLQRIEKIVRADIKVDEAFLSGNTPLHIPANRRVKILMDQQVLTTAYPELLVEGGKNSSITLSYVEALTDKKGNKGNRNDIGGKFMDSDYLDVFLPDGGKNRCFKPLWFRTFRYVELSIVTKEDPLMITGFHSYFTAYPFEENASFESNDAGLSRIWDVGWRTARLCAGETYYDCPYYEQLQYVGDTRIQALISLYVSGDDRLMRNAITQFQQSVLPDGLIQGRYPSSQPLVIPPFALYWVSMVHDYWMHRPDRQFVTAQLGTVKSVLKWYEHQIDQNGMLGPTNWWNFVDWPFGEWDASKPIGGVPKGGMDGNSSIITLQYVYALKMAAALFENEGDFSQAKAYRKLCDLLVSKTKQHCWNAQKGLLADSKEQSDYSQHANIMAILTGMFDKQTARNVMTKVLNDKSLTGATLYYKFYLVEALMKTGFEDLYIEQLLPWKKMIDLGLTTFAETEEPTRSDCHAWSACPNYNLLATVCGISPGSAGFKTVTIAPHPGALKFINAKMPHPNGEIVFSLKRHGANGITADIVLPERVTGKFIWLGKKIALVPGRQSLKIGSF